MTITITSTTRTVHVNNVEARVWEGETESGIPVVVMVTRIAVPPGQDVTQFERELVECRPATPIGIKAWPTRMVL